jgi:hypothetical protein
MHLQFALICVRCHFDTHFFYFIPPLTRRQLKYGVKASSGGGRSSARETIGRVAAGAVAEKLLKTKYGVS